MFTGIIQGKGRVEQVPEASGAGKLVIDASIDLTDVSIGESIAVSGVCLTVVEREDPRLAFDLSQETLRRTALGSLRSGGVVNLERALRASDRLGGHFVQGHVDGVGAVVSVRSEGECRMVEFEVPAGLERYVVEKGSIAVDGISLTVASCSGRRFTVALIPHTLDQTNLEDRAVGERVNLEVDIIAKYVEGLFAREGGSASGS